MSERSYSRVYWSVMDDEKFQGIYEDDGAFACWVRLLMTADALYPQAPHLPRSTKKRPLQMLVDARIVDLLANHRYRIRGLDSERERRKALATTRGPDAHQTVTGRLPDGFGDQTPSQAEKSREENSQAEQSARATDPADALWQLTGKYPAGNGLSWVDDLTSKFGAEAVIRALVTAHTADPATKSLLSRTQDILRSEARELDRREREDEARRLREKRAVPRTEEPWKAEYRRMLEERYGDAA